MALSLLFIDEDYLDYPLIIGYTIILLSTYIIQKVSVSHFFRCYNLPNLLAFIVMGPMGFYTCKADGLRKEPEVYFDFVALIMLTSIYIYGVGKKGIKYATIYYLAAVICVKIPFFFDNSSVSNFPTPLLLRSIRENA